MIIQSLNVAVSKQDIAFLSQNVLLVHFVLLVPFLRYYNILNSKKKQFNVRAKILISYKDGNIILQKKYFEYPILYLINVFADAFKLQYSLLKIFSNNWQ